MPSWRIHDRRIIENRVAFARRRAVLIDQQHFSAGHSLGEFLGIADRRAAADKSWMGSVKRADAFEPAQNVCEIRTENAAIGVNFINHDVFQVFKELDPFRVMRQNALMQHIRIRHHNVSCLPDRRARGRPGVSPS